MKKHNLLKVLLIILFVSVACTWFFPVTSITDKTFVESNNVTVGVFNIGSYLYNAVMVFASVLLYILVIGGFYGILHKIPQYRVLLDKIVEGFKDKEWVFMLIIGIFFSVLTSIAGLSIPILFMFPFVISVILLMGYDKITAAMLTVGSVVAGMIGTVFCNTGLVGSGFTYSSYEGFTNIFSLFGNNTTNYAANSNVIVKIVLLVLCLAVVLINTILYARKHKDSNNLVKGYFVPEKVEVEDKKIIPIAIIFDALLIILTLGFISWDVFGITLFSDITKNFINPSGGIIIKGIYGALNSILGISAEDAFGSWNLVHASIMVFIASCVLAFTYKKSFNSFVDSFGEGLKKAIVPALLVVVSFIILIISSEAPMFITFLRGILDLNSGVNIIVMIIVAFAYCFFIFDPAICILSAREYVGAVITTSTTGLVALIWQSMHGLVMLISPMSVILLSTLAYLGISYGKWFKAIWKLFLELFVIIIFIMYII